MRHNTLDLTLEKPMNYLILNWTPKYIWGITSSNIKKNPSVEPIPYPAKVSNFSDILYFNPTLKQFSTTNLVSDVIPEYKPS